MTLAKKQTMRQAMGAMGATILVVRDTAETMGGQPMIRRYRVRDTMSRGIGPRLYSIILIKARRVENRTGS